MTAQPAGGVSDRAVPRYPPGMAARGWGGSIALAVGVGVGVLVAVAALSARAIATNAVATSGYVWLLAVGSVIFGFAAHRELTTAQLGVWRFGDGHFLRQTYSLPGAALMIGGALVI